MQSFLSLTRFLVFLDIGSYTRLVAKCTFVQAETSFVYLVYVDTPGPTQSEWKLLA